MKLPLLTPTPSMSSRRQLVLTAIRQHFRETGCSPSYAEISIRTGLKPRHVRPHLDQLQIDGLLTFRAGIGRSIVLIDRTANLSDDEIELAAHGRGWQVTKSALPALTQSVPISTRIPAETAILIEMLNHIHDR